MTAKEYLNRYRRINANIDCKLEEIAQLRSKAARLSPTAMFDRSGNVSDKVGRSVAKIVDLETEIDREVDELVETRRDMMQMISRLDNTDMQLILEMRYIAMFSWSQIAEKMHCKKTKTFELHGKALIFVEKLLTKTE